MGKVVWLSAYAHMSVAGDIKDLKSTGECACVDGCLTGSTLGSSCEFTLFHSVGDCCGMHVTCTGDNYVKYLNVSIKSVVEEYTIEMTCANVL